VVKRRIESLQPTVGRNYVKVKRSPVCKQQRFIIFTVASFQVPAAILTVADPHSALVFDGYRRETVVI
jgi:hypothetical protein